MSKTYDQAELVNVINSDGNDVVITLKTGGVIKTNIDGTITGLDADTVDGKHANDFANIDLSNVSNEDFKSKAESSGASVSLLFDKKLFGGI